MQSVQRDTAWAISQEIVEIVRRGHEAYTRGDIAAMLADFGPDVVIHRAPPQPDAGTWQGPEGFLEAFANWLEDFDEFTATAEEFIDANAAQVIARVH